MDHPVADQGIDLKAKAFEKRKRVRASMMSPAPPSLLIAKRHLIKRNGNRDE
jgi:hypothetical protein